ncbi:MAG TPA: gliding motility lipoprotein GldH [Chitinophagaceae bacterium]|nr:gliding motility lipoprotein GldH [Chitinophagaceae bacterium]
MRKYCLLYLVLFFAACGPINTFEKNVAIPGQEWHTSFKPVITFDITDTSSLYNVYVVLRHRNAYRYNNIWIRGTVQQPGDTATRSRQYELKLADDAAGWLGRGMDDIFEHRILIQERTRFTRPGQYRFVLEHTMRNDPLEYVMNVGLRIEKTP